MEKYNPLLRITVVAWCALAVLPSASAYRLQTRWTNTASGPTGQNGSPATLTWSFVADDTSIPDYGRSDLIDVLDNRFNVQSGGPDLTLRSWFPYFASAFERWSELGGLTYLYEPNDDGAQHGNLPGLLGVRGDIRIGGASLDGGGFALGFNHLPPNGDMVLDTDEQLLYTDSTQNHLRLRNIVMHEHGHGLGLTHVMSDDSQFLLEEFVGVAIDGPQLDDIRGLHRAYGDVLEKSNDGAGNDRAVDATPLGTLQDGLVMTIGADAGPDTVVEPHETDFVSIDHSTDFDYFSFVITSPALVDLTLTPRGPTYLEGIPFGSQSPIHAAAISDLALALFDTDGITSIDSEDSSGLGEAEEILDLELTKPGEYFVRIRGQEDGVQLYQLDISATYVPEPSGLLAIWIGLLLVPPRVRAARALRRSSRTTVL